MMVTLRHSRIHNQKVGGSNVTPDTQAKQKGQESYERAFLCYSTLTDGSPGNHCVPIASPGNSSP